jgi:hypothetical protein
MSCVLGHSAHFGLACLRHRCGRQGQFKPIDDCTIESLGH